MIFFIHRTRYKLQIIQVFMGLEPDAIGEMTKNLLTPMKTDGR